MIGRLGFALGPVLPNISYQFREVIAGLHVVVHE